MSLCVLRLWIQMEILFITKQIAVQSLKSLMNIVLTTIVISRSAIVRLITNINAYHHIVVMKE